MKYFYLFIVFGLISCGQSQRQGHQFYFENHSVQTEYEFSHCFKWDSGYLCLAKNNTFVYFDKKLSKSKVVLDSSKNLGFHEINLINDSIICTKYDSVNIKYCYLNKNFSWNPLNSQRNLAFYEDNDFLVSRCCAGEWGGSIFFKDKKSNIVYSTPATCPVAIHKMNGDYYLINSLAHLEGRTEVLKIVDPNKLYKLDPVSLKETCNWWTGFGNHESGYKDMYKYEIGTEKIIDTGFITTITTFQSKNNIYTLSNIEGKTFIGKIDNNQLLEVDSVIDGLYLRPHNSKTNITKNGFLTFFDYEILGFQDFHEKANGFIELESDTIKIVEFKKNDKSP